MSDEVSKDPMVMKKRMTHEDSYFAERDKELVEKHRTEGERKKREEQTQLHYMKCPKCGADLREIEFKDIMIDICTECSGIWLDKGELGILLKKEATLVKSLFNSFFDDEDFNKIK
jgi:uncharacterized protein